MRIPVPTLAMLVLLAVTPTCAQNPQPKQKPIPAVALATNGLAGQPVAVLPLTMVLSDPRIPGGTGADARTKIMRWADSLLGDALTERAPEVQWVLPPALRVTAQRAAGMVPSPDQMGQSVMRSPNLKEAPEPLRSYLRQLVALTNSRFALVPAAYYITPGAADSLTVQLSAVLIDARLGRVLWRTLAVGKGETAAAALRAALGTIVPIDTPPPSP